MAKGFARPSGASASVSVVVYVLITAFILFTYFRALIQLFPYRERIMGGYDIVLAPRFSSSALMAAMVAVFLAVIFYREIFGLVNRIPAALRGLVLPIPFYLLATGDRTLSAVLAVLAAVLWVAYRPVSRGLVSLLAWAPRPVLEPMARFWSGLLYTALVTRAIVPVALAVAVLVGYHYLDQAVERLFAPVWDWHRSLPSTTWLGLFAGRLIVGSTAPFILSMHFAWFNWGYDLATPVYSVIAGALGYFLLRMPRGTDRRAQAS
jgi:hypothetical protein